MMNKLERIAEIETKLAELKKQVEAEQVKEWPQIGDAVWWLATGGDINTIWYDDCPHNSERLARGYLFKTKEEAVEADRKRVAEIAYKNKIKEVNGDWKLDWASVWEVKKYLNYSSYLRLIQTNVHFTAMVLDDSEYFRPDASYEQIEELKRLYAEWKGIDYDE